MQNRPSLTDIILQADLTQLVRLSSMLANAEEYPAAQEINEVVLARIAYLRKQVSVSESATTKMS